MESRRIPVLLLKWIVVPAGLAALGYYIVGPQLGHTAPIQLQETITQATVKELEEANSAEKEARASEQSRSYGR